MCGVICTAFGPFALNFCTHLCSSHVIEYCALQ